jgi:hypothetical protein
MRLYERDIFGIYYLAYISVHIINLALCFQCLLLSADPCTVSLRVASRLADEIHICVLVVARNDSAFGNSLKMLQPLCAAEPCRVVSCQPALRDAISPLDTVSTRISPDLSW